MAYGVGAALRHERARRNISLAEVASQTRISQRFLNAIEEENFDQLPGVVFTRNFVRQYAEVLQIDPDPLLAQLPRVEVADAPMPTTPARPHALRWDPRRNSAISLLGWLTIGIAAVTAGYVHFRHPAATPLTAPIPVVTSALVSATAPEPVVAPAAVAPEPARSVEVVLTAREQSWVQVSADGKIAFTATLQPNESRSVAADDQVKVVTGNAGGVDISLNGKALDPLGPVGQVRTVMLTAAGLQMVQKIPPPQQPPPSDPL